MSFVSFTRKFGAAAVGFLVALVVLEGTLRVFETPEEPPRPRILADALTAPAVARRQLDEGISVAHFSVTGARLTGNAPVPAAEMVVVLGDSYVIAREVDDGETMGGQLEQIARANGSAVNVRQYGWWGAAPAQYLLVASAIRRRWGSAQVMIVLSENDLDGRARQSTPRLERDRSGATRIVGAAADTTAGPPLPSTLWMLMQHRWAALRKHAPAWARSAARERAAEVTEAAAPDNDPPPTATELDVTPETVVRALAAAYGDRLSVVYLADVGISGGELPTDAERRLLDACRAGRLSCVSARPQMLAMRRRGLLAGGLSTRDVGSGHLNVTGHRIMADAMWDLLQARARSHAPTTRP